MTLPQEFRSRLASLARRYPSLARGGLSRQQLKELASRLARRLGYHLEIVSAPWPWPATISRVGDNLVITVDHRRDALAQLMALAHEVGHVALGHMHAEPFWTDVDGPYSREEDEWADLFAAIVLDKCTSPVEYLGREQLELL
jgi:hypothetical protein